MLNVLLITIVQRCCLFYITYLVLLSFGIDQLGMVDVVVLQAMISLAVDMLPLPGGMGISEHLFQIIFLPICGALLYHTCHDCEPRHQLLYTVNYKRSLYCNCIFNDI